MFFTVSLSPTRAQISRPKEVNHQIQTWVSINSLFRLNPNWGVLADFHIRRNDFVEDPSFYFLRLGANYWIKDNMTAALGYGHTWFAPIREDGKTWTNENRVYQQFLVGSSMGRTGITQRVRNEQRWVQLAENDQLTGKTRFANRVRYLASFNFRIFPKPGAPTLVLADEILVQFGKDVVYNTFDQNRLFIGINKKVNPRLSFDFGYMNVYQQKITGYQYDMNHTIRLFFYYNGGRNKEGHTPATGHHDE
ncbi:MAG: DUF2490 domain-containing protein [Chitinophagaceae bacterium]|jgi:hypothetical protein|nr:DUF2490 domain-containing protein [Chitinophagaceae bacterium]